MEKKKLLCSAHSFKEKLDLLDELSNLKIYRWINKAKDGERSEHRGGGYLPGRLAHRQLYTSYPLKVRLKVSGGKVIRPPYGELSVSTGKFGKQLQCSCG